MRVRSVGALIAVLAVLASLAVPAPAQEAAEPSAPPPPPPSLAVWPRTNLVDGQELRLNLRNWPDTNTYLAAVICHAEDNAHEPESRCDYLGEMHPGPQGGARIRRPADVIVDGAEPVDCRVEPCEVQVFDYNTSDDPARILLRVAVTFDPTGPDPTRPPTTATPTTDLRADDVVQVTGNGYPLRLRAPGETAQLERELPGGEVLAEGSDGPARPVSLYQCRASATSYHGCDLGSRVVGMSPAGDFTAAVSVRSRLYLHSGGSVDCRSEGCVIVATSNHQYSEAGVVPLAFDPDGPAPPEPVVSITPDGPLQDDQEVTITASDFPPRWSVRVAQCPPDPVGPYYFFSCHDVFGLWDTDAQGGATFAHPVHSRLNPYTGPAVDCTTVTCRFVVTWAEVDEAPGAPLVFDDDVSGAPRRITASRLTDLVDEQWISVRGQRYDADEVTVRQCVVGRVDFDSFRCDNRLRVRVDPDGTPSFTLRYRVRQFLQASNHGRVNCARRTCYLATIGDENGFVRGPRLTFRS